MFIPCRYKCLLVVFDDLVVVVLVVVNDVVVMLVHVVDASFSNNEHIK